MADLPLIQLPMPEEEQPLTLYGRITNTNEPPKYDDIQNSNLPKEEKVRQIQYRTKAYQDDVDRQLHKDYARMGAGTALSAASFLPIFNIPYVGTGIGGAMYDLGQGIVEGDTAGDLAKRAGRGFVIGETIGAIPYAGKALGKTKAGQAVINSAPVQAVGGALNKAGEKFANTKLYDALMTDIKAFNPNKQTAYHGSPYDFNKFSNEAIGTGEGAQAHGYGHYAALNKGTAEEYAKNLSKGNKVIEYNGKVYKSNDAIDPFDYNYKMLSDVKDEGLESAIESVNDEIFWAKNKLSNTDEEWKKWWQDYLNDVEKKAEKIKTINPNAISEIKPDTGQLYKLSIPKDDVMLREGASFENQPELVQKGLNNIKKNYLKSKGYNSIDDINAELDSLSDQYENIVKNESPYNFYAGNEKSEIQAKISQLENLRRFNETPDLYNYLLNHQHLEPHEVSDLLYKQGIKGISYNGGIDGEAAVIFNPDDIDIVRKFYNKQGALEYLKRMNPNIGSETVAIGNGLVDKNYWKQYAKDNFLGNSVDIPGYTTVNFTNNNLMRDYPYNMPEYPNLFEQLTNSKYGFSTNYNKEKDRLYDHLINNDNNRLFDYLIEVIQDNDGNIHHNYKMMKNITRGDKP